jgi:hypothetical protein
MKRFIFFSFFLLLFSISQAQISKMEYTYITEGYKEDYQKGRRLESDFALKHWYDSKSFDKGSGQTRKFKIHTLLKTGSPKKTIAVVMMLVDVNNNLDWIFCVPSQGSSPDVWDKFWNEIYGSSPGIKNAVIRELSLMSMTLMKTVDSK